LGLEELKPAIESLPLINSKMKDKKEFKGRRNKEELKTSYFKECCK